ncbi:unnamed protein product [Phytomonas sp. Hart1]|nr:unnamed protein product [Phytomonas sp. Hart1]|eukprot:CCW67730.1 unnamed protein product [Phytomonas sp. isolate Hart1]
MTDSMDAISEALISAYGHLSALLHLPSIEREFYEMFFVNTLQGRTGEGKSFTPPNVKKDLEKDPMAVEVLVGALSLIVGELQGHYRRTVAVLKSITRREDLMFKLIDASDAYEGGGCPLDQAQVGFLSILHDYQRATLQVVEALTTWRKSLTRPYPFYIHSSPVNYLEQILEDGEAISGCPLGRSLSLHFGRFPCGSVINFPRLLRSARAKWRARILNTGAVLHEGVAGLQLDRFQALSPPHRPFSRFISSSSSLREGPHFIPNSRNVVIAPTGDSEAFETEKDPKRRLAEEVILKEPHTQKCLAKELYDLAGAFHPEDVGSSKRFLLTLSLPGLFLPLDGSSTTPTFPLDKGQWWETLRQVLDQAHCVEVASRARERWKRPPSRVLKESKPNNSTTRVSTSRDSQKPPSSGVCSDSGDRTGGEALSSSLQSQSRTPCAPRHFRGVKPLSEKLLRQTLNSINEDLEP